MSKDLKDKAIDIKGKKYVLVSDRVIYFNDTYPNGMINTELISDPISDHIIVKATIVPDIDKPLRTFSDYSQATKGDGMVNRTAALENASTSAVGRALAMMGIGVLDSIASVDEINKATGSTGKSYQLATPKQIAWIRSEIATAINDFDEKRVDKWAEDYLTLIPDKIPSFKVSDAVDKIRALAKEMATQNEKEEIIHANQILNGNLVVNDPHDETVREKAKRLYIDKHEDNEEDQELLSKLRSEDE